MDFEKINHIFNSDENAKELFYRYYYKIKGESEV